MMQRRPAGWRQHEHSPAWFALPALVLALIAGATGLAGLWPPAPVSPQQPAMHIASAPAA